jgi:membrane protease YdiL (CAAX protease family)
MSIVLAAEVERMSPWMLGGLLVISLITLGATAAVGAFRPRTPDLLLRLFGKDAPLPFVFNGIAAAVVFFAGQMIAFAVIIYNEGGLRGNPEEFLTGPNLVWLALASHGPSALAMLIGLAFFIRNGFERIGLKREPLLGGMMGLGLIVAAMPGLLFIMGATEWLYHFIGYQHENAHELLQAMEPGNMLVQVLAVVAAVVGAPLSEELFFRGHVQALLRRLAATWFPQRADLPVAAPVDPNQLPAYAAAYQPPTGVPGYPPSGYVPAPLATPVYTVPLGYVGADQASPVPAKSFWPSFIAIVGTSLVFTCVHPMWSWPPIFVLSVVLGFAYERTGNLWVPIAMHAVFNGTMTSLYLWQMAGGS